MPHFTLDLPRSMIDAPMTKREAIRRLEHLAVEAGHKRSYYVKRALLEFLDRNEHLLDFKPTSRSGFSALNHTSSGSVRSPQFADLIREE
jgi:hypothetical protein